MRNAFLPASALAVIISLSLAVSALAEVGTNDSAAPIGEKPDVKPFEPPVVIAGTARARGQAYGKRFREGIHDFLNREIYTALVGKPSSKEEMLAYAADCAVVVREMCPMIAEELAGIAEGAGLEFNEVVLIQLHEEVYHRTPLPKHGHCTAVAVGPTDSTEKHAFVGQTWDWMTTMAGKSQLTEWRRGVDGADVLAYSYPGLPFGAGMNSHGIAFCWTSAALKLKNQSPRVGLPSYVLIAHLLNQKDVDSLVREAKRDKQAGWFTFVFNDSQGNIVNIEGSPAGVVVEQSSGRMVRAEYGTTNKRAEMTAALPSWKPPPRCAALDKLLESSAGRNGRATLQEYLQDPKHGISFAGRPKNQSIDVILFDTTAKRAYVTRGPDYGIEWREFGFGN
jgi:isopenicillin-N N-acyltransferase-like protein